MSAASTSTTTISTSSSSSSSPLTLMCVTGRTGGHAVTSLLDHKDDSIYIRGIVRSEEKGDAWLKKLNERYGADRIKQHVTYAVVPDELDTAALTKAFTNSSAVYVMLSPHFPDADFSSTKKKITAIVDALKAAGGTATKRIVALSSIGAHLTQGVGIVSTLHLLEQSLTTSFPTSILTFIRAGSFYENTLHGDMASAKTTGTWSIFYPQPLGTKYHYISTIDIGSEVAKYLVERTDDRTVTKTSNPLYIELEGPQMYNCHDFASIYTKSFGHTCTPSALPREEWSARLTTIGIPPQMQHGLIDMSDAINKGELKFEDKPEKGTVHVKGKITLEEGLAELIREFQASQQQKNFGLRAAIAKLKARIGKIHSKATRNE